MDERLKKLLELLEQALQLVKEHEETRARFMQSELPKAVETGKIEIVNRAAQMYLRTEEKFGKSIDEVLTAARDLARTLAQEPMPSGPRPIAPLDLATRFQAVVESLQMPSRPKPDAESAVLLRSLDIEVKGLIVIEDEQPKIVTPEPGSTVDPAQLSTVRMSFGSVPVLRKPGVTPPD